MRRSLALFLVCLASLTLFAGVPPALGEDPPSVRMFAATSDVDVAVPGGGYAYLDPGVWIATTGGAFELRAFRVDYDSPVELVQTDAETGAVLRTLPAELLEGWSGLRSFIHVSVKTLDGRLVLRQPFTFCPNTYNRARLDDEGPLTSTYPYICGGNPFTKGTVWGIDGHWAVNAVGDYGLAFRATQPDYQVHAWIDPAWVTALGIAPEDAEASVLVHIVEGHGGHVPASRLASPYARGADVPTVTDPDPETLPDLVALPAWGIATYSRRGKDYLTFNATEWNGGPGTMIVEGFRPPDEDLMDAYQYFLLDGVVVGRAPVGQLEFHPQHSHWHFKQFTEYSLLDADSREVQLSGKQSWCLANTDALDLTIPNANWNAYSGDVFTMCGGPGAIWIREVLDVGWGDTYAQYIAGQAFNITDLPNGDYYIRVQVNPEGSLFEGSAENNAEDRLIKLRGKPGHRTVIVPPWHGIDTEGCFYCG